MLNINKKIGTIRVNFTPAFFNTALREANNGKYAKLVALMEAAEQDAYVAGCLEGRYAGFSRDFHFVEASDNPEDVKVKDFITELFQGYEWNDLFEDIFDARKKKYSVIEYDDWTTHEGKQVPTGFSKIHQKYFSFVRDARLSPENLKIDDGGKLIDIPEDQALVVVSKRPPVLLPVLRDYILKEFGLETYANFIEIIGVPFVLGKYPDTASPQVREQLEEAVETLAKSARGTMPASSNIEIRENKQSSSVHEPFIEIANKSISVAILGHGNAIDETGGLKLGENLAPYKVKREIAVKDIRFISPHVNKLVKKIVAMNFDKGKPPTLDIDDKEPVDPDRKLKALKQFYDQGGKVDPTDYKELGVTVEDDQDFLFRQDAPD